MYQVLTVRETSKTIHPLEGVRPLHRMVWVFPLYDADQIIGIYQADAWKNPEAQQGIVVAKGPESEFDLLDHVIFHPYSADDASGSIRHEGETYLRLWDHTIVGRAKDRRLVPRSGHLVVLPDWSQRKWRRTASGLFLLNTTAEANREPPTLGRVITAGSSCQEVKPGDFIIYPSDAGEEIGWIDGVIYIIPEWEVLAICQ